MTHRTARCESGSRCFPVDSGRDRRAALPVLYLVGIVAGEVVLRAGASHLALTAYGGLMLTSIYLAAFGAPEEQAISLAVTVVALVRVVGLTMPLGAIEPAYWHAVIALPVLVGAVSAANRAGYSREDVGVLLNRRAVVTLVVLVPVAIIAALAAYRVLGTLPLVSRLSAEDALLPALAIGLATGPAEELVFRGLFQTAAVRRLGRLPGAAYTTAVFVLVAAAQWTPAVLAVVVVLGVLFSLVTLETRSIVPAAGAHGAFNVTLLIVGPFLLQG